MHPNLFIYPFTAGLIFILGYFFVRSFLWLQNLKKEEKIRIIKGIPSIATFRAILEVSRESLLHLKIFRTNPLLGYMHMSLAFGWFLLIVGGNLEALSFRPGTFHPPHYPIFFRYFEPKAVNFSGAAWFSFLMDLFLLLILSGVGLAMFKRVRSRILGLKKTTRLQWNDKIALVALWTIFPARLLAESFTSGVEGHGGFLTGTLGSFFNSILPVEVLVYPAWWVYSLALGTFFFALPFSRYMHIPTEVLLIFLRNYGIKTGKKYSPFSEIEVFSCSRCGICLDPCPMATAAGVNNIQSVYFIHNVRNGILKKEIAQNCLMCGRCNQACPVGIDNYALRSVKRESFNNNKLRSSFDYIPDQHPIKAHVAYFAGCMGQLTPSVTRSMEHIMQSAGVQYSFLDKNESICCGRPLMLSGRDSEGGILMNRNRELILASGAGLLVTSCPICYKMFREEYNLDIQVMHHSEYLKELFDKDLLKLKKSDLRLVYHDPCELGRGSGIYEQPRQVIKSMANLIEPENSKEKAICCGGSLGNTVLGNPERRKITQFALENLKTGNPDQIITSCPLCKKTFSFEAGQPVYDLAEVVAKALIKERKKSLHPATEFTMVE